MKASAREGATAWLEISIPAIQRSLLPFYGETLLPVSGRPPSYAAVLPCLETHLPRDGEQPRYLELWLIQKLLSDDQEYETSEYG